MESSCFSFPYVSRNYVCVRVYTFLLLLHRFFRFIHRRCRRHRRRRRLGECSELTRERSEREVEAINLRHVSEFRA